MTGDISIAELARQVQEVLRRFQGLADRLDTSYVSKEVFDLYKRSIDQSLTNASTNCSNLERDKAEKLAFDDAIRRIANIEDNMKWIVRLLLALIVVAVVGTVISTGGAS